jgi:plastocyanin
MKTFWKFAVALSASASLLAAGSSSVSAAEWGDLKMTFKVQGKAPTMEKLKPNKDTAVCANPKNPPLLDEAFVVGKDGGVKNVLVFLVPEKGSKIEAHESYNEDAKATVELDNKNCQFVPHVVTVRTSQTLTLKNSDPIGHNSKLDFLANSPQNPIIPGNGEFLIKATDITKPEKRATPVSCSIHPWMTAWVLVQDHPYMAVSDENGVVEIKNLPVGKHTFQVWQEQVGNVNPVGAKQKFTKGKVEIEIKAGENDLGELKVKPK